MNPNDMFPIEKSRYYNFYLLEKQEIDKLKWVESEKAGYDIGISHARFLWNFQHRYYWMQAIKASGVYEKLVISS
jgi:hypothetical protein